MGEHLKVLAKVARLLRDSFVTDLIRKVSTPEHIREFLQQRKNGAKDLRLV